MASAVHLGQILLAQMLFRTFVIMTFVVLTTVFTTNVAASLIVALLDKTLRSLKLSIIITGDKLSLKYTHFVTPWPRFTMIYTINN